MDRIIGRYVLSWGALTLACLTVSSVQAQENPLLAPRPRAVPATIPGTLDLPEGTPSAPRRSVPGRIDVDQTPGTAAVPGGAPPAPATPADGCATCDDGKFDFSRVPNVKPLAPAINFPQSGPGYYSFLDVLNGNYRSGPPKYGYTRSAFQALPLYDADFRYLDDPENEDHVWSDKLKRIKLGDDWMFSTGGQAWNRYMNIPNQGLGTVRGVNDLTRARVYGDLWFQDRFRIYAEFISAYNVTQNIAPGPLDNNKADFQNLFIDVKLFELDGRPAYARVGRQELALGSQRLISTLDFANTRRTFEGARFTYRGDAWDFDAWWLRPLIIDPNKLDPWDAKQNFAGSFATYHPNKTDLVDFYYLYLSNRNAVTQLGILRDPATLHTFGSRYTGNHNGFLWDFEGAMQLGSTTGSPTVAGMGVAGLGYNFKCAPWNPTIWGYYDYASGDRTVNSGNVTTFNQLFPFGHLYLGGMDLIGRQNINDLNLQFQLNPTPYISFWTQYHYLWLDSATDALYNAAGVAIRRSATGAAGRNVGSELNFIVNFHLTPNQDIQVGYAHLFGGSFLKATGSSTVDYTYLCYNLKW